MIATLTQGTSVIPSSEILDAGILVVDDDAGALRTVRRVLEKAGYRGVRTVTRGEEVEGCLSESPVDLLLLDLHLDGMDGFEVLERLRSDEESGPSVPVLVLTGDADSAARDRAFDLGARDFLIKPPDSREILARVRNLLMTHLLRKRVESHALELESRVEARTRELERLKLELLNRLAVVAEYRDDVTGTHQERVGIIAGLISRDAGVDERATELIRRAAPLHDIGKVAIPDAILFKPGGLDKAEFSVMRSHTLIGARMLQDGDFPLLWTAEKIALTHHERWDGRGYPLGLKGRATPLPGRITAVADVFDSLTHARPYRAPLAPEEALGWIERDAGSHLDPHLVPVLRALWETGELESVLAKECGEIPVGAESHRTPDDVARWSEGAEPWTAAC
jgi:cyclic di-GMP phosphodiesterase